MKFMDQTNLKRVHPPAFKAKVALEALKEQKTIAQLSSICQVPNFLDSHPLSFFNRGHSEN